MASEMDHKAIEKATLYDLRLLIKGSSKENYTKEELLDFLDTVAEAKAQPVKQGRRVLGHGALVHEPHHRALP